MKPSRYNIRENLPDGTALLFNSFSLNFLAVESDKEALLDSCFSCPREDPFNEEEQILFNLLQEQGFIISDDIDEFEELKRENSRARHQRSHLGLTIAPSMACNFDCSYCYQDEVGLTMSPAVEAAIIPFIDSHLPQNGTLSLTWFGGEPLLQMDVISRLTKKIDLLLSEKKASRVTDIITNGYLLDSMTVDRLVDLGVKGAQLTLDGTETIHNLRRPLKGGEKTFGRILENLKTASERLDIAVRMNVDDSNRDEICELLDLLAEQGLSRRIHFYPGRTYPYTASCQDVSSVCLTGEDFSLLGLETVFQMIDKGFCSLPMPHRKNLFCLADCDNSFVVTPSGGIVRCWNDVGNPHHLTGHLVQPEGDSMRRNRNLYTTRDPFEGECAECGLLPICMGGCPYIYHLSGRLNCHAWKHNPAVGLAMHYYVNRMIKETKIIKGYKKLVQIGADGALPRGSL